MESATQDANNYCSLSGDMYTVIACQTLELSLQINVHIFLNFPAKNFTHCTIPEVIKEVSKALWRVEEYIQCTCLYAISFVFQCKS